MIKLETVISFQIQKTLHLHVRILLFEIILVVICRISALKLSKMNRPLYMLLSCVLLRISGWLHNQAV